MFIIEFANFCLILTQANECHFWENDYLHKNEKLMVIRRECRITYYRKGINIALGTVNLFYICIESLWPFTASFIRGLFP